MCLKYIVIFTGLVDKIFANKITVFILLWGKELLRCKKLYSAVDKAAASYGNHVILTACIGAMGACGGGVINHAIACVKNNVSSIKDHSLSK